MAEGEQTLLFPELEQEEREARRLRELEEDDAGAVLALALKLVKKVAADHAEMKMLVRGLASSNDNAKPSPAKRRPSKEVYDEVYRRLGRMR